MSSSTATISSTNSTMNNNDRKRPISSSIRPSPSPPSAKRHNLSSTNKNVRRSGRHERQSRSKQQYRHIDNKSSSSESSRSSSNSNHSLNQEYSSTTTIGIKNSNEILSTKKAHLNSNQKSETIYTKKPTSIALIVKPTTNDQRNLVTNYDSDEDFERTKQISNKILTKSSHVVVPSSVMAIVTTPDLPKKSTVKDNVIIQQLDGNMNPNSSTKLVKLVVPQSTSSPSIKMLSSGDGLASALRVPTKIQLTKTLCVSSTKNDQISSSLISSTHSNNQERVILSPSSTTLLDIPIDMTEKQQSVVDYHSSTTLPPTPPPPVIDNTNSNVRNVLSHKGNNEQQQEKQQQQRITTINTKIIEENDCSINDEHSNDQTRSKHHSSSLSDWSVPPTSELSPRSLTSSSPDLTQTHLPPDDALIELESTINLKQSTKRRCQSVSSFTVACLQSNETFLKPIKSKSLTRLSNSSEMKFMLMENKRSLTSSPILKLSSSQRIRKRRRDNENLILNQQKGKTHKSKAKHIKIESVNHLIIQNLLNEIIERILSTNDDKDNALKTLLIKPVPHFIQTIPIDVVSNRQTKTLVHKKSYSSSQSLDSTIQNESRSMIMTPRELDELAYLLHANAQRGDYERSDNPAKVEERMREMWSQMSFQKKNTYYKRVIQIYKKPNRDVVISSSSSTIENQSFLSNDSIEKTNPLSIELKRQTSTPLSFHSIASSITDESSQESMLKTNIFTDIINELIKGAKGLDKLSCSPTIFVNSIDNFVRSTIDQQNEIITNLERQVEKKCLTQLNRATIFWTQKINYFATKHHINSSNESMNELTLIVKYFYLFVLSLNCRKQETEFESAITDLLNGNLTFIDESFSSPVLTSIIEDLILRSTLANDYLASQFLIINEIEYSLPFIRHIDLENDLLIKNDAHLLTNPFLDFNDLDDYLNRCEHMTTTIPCYPAQQSHHSSMFYPAYHPPPPPQYYYPPPSQSSEMNNYYYNPTTVYPNSQQQQQQIYPYGSPTSYYHPSTTFNNNNNNNNEQFKYYYNQQQSSYTYSSPTNSTNDIPSLPNNPSFHRTYRQMNSNIQRTYSNPQQQPATPGTAPTTPGTPAVFDTTTVVSPQSKSMNTINNNYPP